MPDLQRDDLLNNTPMWLLTLSWAGRDIRLSSRPVTVYDDDGNAYAFDGGFPEPDFEDSIELMTSDLNVRSVPIEVVLPGVDVAREISRGHDLSAAVGELALWAPGTEWEDRRVMVQGIIRQPLYGGAGEPVAFTLEELPWHDTGTLCPAVLTNATWTGLYSTGEVYGDDESVGFPIVFGSPGLVGGERIPGTWATRTDMITVSSTAASSLMVAGHPVVAGEFEVFCVKANTWTTINGSDVQQRIESGQTVTLLDTAGESSGFLQNYEDGYAIAWTAGGGMANPYGEGVLEGAGDVLRFALSRSSLRVDDGRCAAAAKLLNSYKLAGFVDNFKAKAYNWIADNLVPILPISMHPGPDGLYPVVWRYDALPSDAIDHLEAGAGITRAGPVEYTQKVSDLRNAVSVRWALNVVTKAYTRSSNVSAEVAESFGGGGTLGTLYTEASQRRYGLRSHTVETELVYDEATAVRIAMWMTRAYGFSHRQITYEIDLDRGWLSPGDVVTLTDSDLYIDGQVALVRSVQWGGPSLMITLLVIEDPARDSRYSS